VAKDAEQNRYSSFNDLAGYAYGVASTVGLMAMHIIGYSHPDALSYAVKLGVALQLTNILRDVGEDWRKGRVYLPQEELAQYSLSDADIAAGVVDDRWRAFMRFQIERNRQIYRESLHGIQLLQRDGRFAINAAAGLYQGILDDIEHHDYDVFSRRAHLSTWGKISRLPSLWWNATTA
jgi:phytoene synthase